MKWKTHLLMFALFYIASSLYVGVRSPDSIVSAQANPCITGTWSITNQPPSTCIPFAQNGIYTKQLPHAGSGGPQDHLFPNSAAIIANVMNPNAANFCPGCSGGGFGYMLAAGPGNYVGDGIGEPIYFGRSSDPIYKVAGCNLNQGDNYPSLYPQWNPIGKTYHIPNRAMPANTNPSTGISTCHDSFMVVWDQTSNEVLGVYNGCTAKIGLDNCTATTVATACATPGWRSCDQANWSTDPGYRVKPGATGALDTPGWALTVRTKEWMPPEGHINHAIYLNTGCENGPNTVFPDQDGPAGVCSSAQVQGNWPGISNTNRLFEGNMVFADYTVSQLATLKGLLPAWQYPFIEAMVYYGGYVGDTGQGTGNISPSRIESNQAYAQASITNPLYAWLEGQPGVSKNGIGGGVFQYAMSAFTVPLIAGTDIRGHLHVADPCVPLGMAGLAGGCVSSGPPPVTPAPPTNLTAIVTAFILWFVFAVSVKFMYLLR